MREPVQTPPGRMTSEEFLAWHDRQPEGRRYELLDGAPIRIMADCEVVIGGERVPMQAERNVHARAKHIIAVQFQLEVDRKHIPCFAYGDGMAVQIDDTTTFEPDAMVRCGPELPPDAVAVPDPLIVVEVSSGLRHKVGTDYKLSRYFDNPHLMRDLVVLTRGPRVIHHRRAGRPDLLTSIHAGGALALDPPGVALDLDALFAALPQGGEADE